MTGRPKMTCIYECRACKQSFHVTAETSLPAMTGAHNDCPYAVTGIGDLICIDKIESPPFDARSEEETKP